MPKFVVSLTEYTFFNVPVIAANEKEAEKRARDLVADHSYPADDVILALSEQFDDTDPPVEEVDDATFARFIAPEAA